MKSSFLLAFLALFCFFNFSSQQLAGGFTPMTVDEVEENPNAEEALQFGANYVIAKLISKSVIPSGDAYSVSKIISAAQQVVAGVNYQFEAGISNEEGSMNFSAVYVVFRDLKGNQEVNFWGYIPPNSN